MTRGGGSPERALLHEPHVLLMEVGLDAASCSDLLKLILSMRTQRSVAVLTVPVRAAR